MNDPRPDPACRKEYRAALASEDALEEAIELLERWDRGAHNLPLEDPNCDVALAEHTREFLEGP